MKSDYCYFDCIFKLKMELKLLKTLFACFHFIWLCTRPFNIIWPLFLLVCFYPTIHKQVIHKIFLVSYMGQVILSKKASFSLILTLTLFGLVIFIFVLMKRLNSGIILFWTSWFYGIRKKDALSFKILMYVFFSDLYVLNFILHLKYIVI